MNTALQRLTKKDESAILALAEAHECDVSLLRCNMTRQQGHGGKTAPNGRYWSASYDLLLCEFCGNLMLSRVCPAKARQLEDRLKQIEA